MSNGFFRGSLLAVLLVACCPGGFPDAFPGGVYCQTGPKYGTECYAAADVQNEQRQQGRNPPPEEWSERWNRLRSPTASAPVQASSAGVSGSGSAPKRSVEVSFSHGALEEASSSEEETRRVAARRYAAALADWLEPSWRELAEPELPCFEEIPQTSSVRLGIDGDGRVVQWQWVSHPADGILGTMVERAADGWRGETIPRPPQVFGDLQPRSLDVELTNRGFECVR